ncbi:Hypothetical protein, perdicted transmembrane protein [Mycoplasmopsis bovigenitalium 51080]|uniref:Uncharacterized protein n=1 Tax=Mycoplasmopsis bovigenitalium 51080 TaxID=1188235 RepID=N9V3S7_9BACT|nr:hypothetical protein [Mycoplasmopsis bovigenitalium]ENY70017.1 Hypothetical protein, perdicted transmembrane protein [Mycoplasmopsis bovigenitalium 51080]
MEEIILLVAVLFILFLSFSLLISGIIMHVISLKSNRFIAVFKLDSKEKWVMKVSEDNLSSSLSLNFSTQKVSKNKFYKINDFLSLFDKKTASDIQKIIEENKFQKRYSLTGALNPSKKEKLIRSLLFIKKIKKDKLFIRIYGKNDDNSFYISLSAYEQIKKKSQNYDILTDANAILKTTAKNSFQSIVFPLKLTNVSPMSESSQIDKFIQILNLDQTKWIKLKYGALMFLIYKEAFSGFSINKIKEKISNYNNSFEKALQFSPVIFVTSTYPNSLENFNKIYHFSLNKLSNSNEQSHFIINVDNLDIEQQNFSIKIEDFNKKIKSSSFINEFSQIKKLKNDSLPSSSSIVLGKVAGIDSDDLNLVLNFDFYKSEFFHKINLFQYSLDNKSKKILLHTTEYNLWKYNSEYNLDNVLFIIRPHAKYLDIALLNKVLITNPKLNIGIYVNEITPKLIEFILRSKIKYFVIASNLTQNINEETDKFIHLFNFVSNISKKNKPIIIWENLPKNINNEQIERLNINYNYNNQYTL